MLKNIELTYFMLLISFLCPLKTSESLWFSDYSRVIEIKQWHYKWVKYIVHYSNICQTISLS